MIDWEIEYVWMCFCKWSLDSDGIPESKEITEQLEAGKLGWA